MFYMSNDIYQGDVEWGEKASAMGSGSCLESGDTDILRHIIVVMLTLKDCPRFHEE